MLGSVLFNRHALRASAYMAIARRVSPLVSGCPMSVLTQRCVVSIVERWHDPSECCE
jgi:hypothetical protein